jgi:hypothetical protein
LRADGGAGHHDRPSAPNGPPDQFDRLRRSPRFENNVLFPKAIELESAG